MGRVVNVVLWGQHCIHLSYLFTFLPPTSWNRKPKGRVRQSHPLLLLPAVSPPTPHSHQTNCSSSLSALTSTIIYLYIYIYIYIYCKTKRDTYRSVIAKFRLHDGLVSSTWKIKKVAWAAFSSDSGCLQSLQYWFHASTLLRLRWKTLWIKVLNE